MRVRRVLAAAVLVGLGAIAAWWWGTHATQESPAATASTSVPVADVTKAPPDRGGRRTSPRDRVRSHPDGEDPSVTGRAPEAAPQPSTSAAVTPAVGEKPESVAPADPAVSIRSVEPSGATGVVRGEASRGAAREDDVRPGVVRGRIVETDTAKPIVGVDVRTSEAECATTTDDDGNFRLEGVAPGAQRITLSKDGFELRDVDITVVARREVVVDETLQTAATLRLTLRRRDGSAYVGRARLILGQYTPRGTIGTGYDITADKDGSAVFREIVPGLYRVVVIADRVGQARALEVKVPLGAAKLDLTLE